MARVCLLLSLMFMVIAGCSWDKVQKRKNEITKICFGTGGCLGQCPILAIEIDSSLIYKFYGGEYSDTIGYFRGSVSQSFWDTLNSKLENINYKYLDTSYEHSVDDVSTETIIYYNNRQKHILAQEMSLPDNVRNVLFWLSDTYKSIPLKKVTDNSISFETKIQNSFPIKTTVKFTPPE
jgi:hypothetical protein